ncbi:alpha/beta hydrolase [Halioxenophilus aromaticivorans]|uniref:Alpha/beta hydrolase n=1 Tax=Halioxenophilus aromaticivorans TaxID=1306992 RepID=A0AAV3TWS5_9ALTE
MAKNSPYISQQLIAQELRPALAQLPSTSLSTRNLPKVRNAIRQATQLQLGNVPAELLEVDCQSIRLPSDFGGPDIPALMYTPKNRGTNLPVALHFHGGGYILGEPGVNDTQNRTLAKTLGCVVVSVAYRLAPEHPYPSALQDGLSALNWLHSNAQCLAIDPSRIALIGESAGAGLAAAIALHSRGSLPHPVKHLLLDAPMLDDRSQHLSVSHPYCGEYSWTAQNNHFAWRAYLAAEPGGESAPEGAVPARETDLSGMPATFLIVGALDLFLNENLVFGNRLIQCGVPVELHVIPGAFHAYGIAGPEAPQVKQTHALKYQALTRAWQ